MKHGLIGTLVPLTCFLVSLDPTLHSGLRTSISSLGKPSITAPMPKQGPRPLPFKVTDAALPPPGHWLMFAVETSRRVLLGECPPSLLDNQLWDCLSSRSWAHVHTVWCWQGSHQSDVNKRNAEQTGLPLHLGPTRQGHPEPTAGWTQEAAGANSKPGNLVFYLGCLSLV